MSLCFFFKKIEKLLTRPLGVYVVDLELFRKGVTLLTLVTSLFFFSNESLR